MPDWPHAPIHRLTDTGAYMVTAGTYGKLHHFRDPVRLTLLQDQLLGLALEHRWQLQAWAIFSNHYHFIAVSEGDAVPLLSLIRRLHAATAQEVNRLDGTEGRRVWFEYWDTRLTFERSYLARLQYVHQNPVRHGLVQAAARYPWCSAAWFEQRAPPSFFRTVTRFKIDRVRVLDDYLVELDEGTLPG
jgi:putative transposase